MNVLPRLLYLLQAIPIKLPPSFFASFKRMCRNLLWSARAPRLSWDKLILPKGRGGGIGLPDLTTYYRACHLTRIVDWHAHKTDKDWIQVENAFSRTPLHRLPWTNPRLIPKTCSDHLLIGPTLLNFKTACRIFDMPPFPGPMTPLTQNPAFPPDISSLDLTVCPLDLPVRAHQFFNADVLLSHPEMSTKFPNMNIPLFKFLQLRHFFHSTPRLADW